jgi:hypothetical protein
MTISRVNAGTWSVGDKLTAAQINQLDVNTTYALDKRAGQTDTLESQVTVASGAWLRFANGSTGNQLLSGSQLTVNSGATLTVSGSAVVTGASAKLSTASSGRIEHGDNDYPLLSASHTGRSRTVSQSVLDAQWMTSSAWTVGAISLTTVTSPGGVFRLFFEPHNGATLSTVTLHFIAAAGHGALPAVFPKFDVRRAATASSLGSTASLRAAGAMSYSTALLATYNDGAVKTIAFSCDQNNVIDRSQYLYWIDVTDESGANSIVGNAYYTFLYAYSAIADLRFA